jgi:cytochrome c oxidase subunit 3
MSTEHQVPHFEDSGLPQPYHLVKPSAWPFFGAMLAGLLAVGIVMFMHKVKLGGMEIGLKGVFLGLAGVVAIMIVWWRDIIHEAVVEKAHSPLVKIGLRYGMALFIASEVMFFAAFFWAYFNSAMYPAEAIGFKWPPANIKTFSPFDMPFTMTMVLLLSGTTVTWAHHAILEGKQKEAARALGITVCLGFFFSCLQAFEYSHAQFSIKDGIFGSTFYMATGFHGLHVIIGTIFLAICWWRTKQGHFTADSHFGLEAAAWYWHFVDVVWLFLFSAVYWYGSH